MTRGCEERTKWCAKNKQRPNSQKFHCSSKLKRRISVFFSVFELPPFSCAIIVAVVLTFCSFVWDVFARFLHTYRITQTYTIHFYENIGRFVEQLQWKLNDFRLGVFFSIICSLIVWLIIEFVTGISNEMCTKRWSGKKKQIAKYART